MPWLPEDNIQSRSGRLRKWRTIVIHEGNDCVARQDIHFTKQLAYYLIAKGFMVVVISDGQWQIEYLHMMRWE